MSEEKKTVEIKDEELEKVSGGGRFPRPDGAPSCWEEAQQADYANASIKPDCISCPFASECGAKYYYPFSKGEIGKKSLLLSSFV